MMPDIASRAPESDKMERRGLMKALDASQCLLWFDANGRVIDANPNALRLLGFSAEEILHQDFFALTADRPGQILPQKRTWLRIASGDHVHSECGFHGKNGTEVWASVSYAAIRRENGEVRRVLALLIDLSKWAWKPSSNGYASL